MVSVMHVIARAALREFWETYPETKAQLVSWYKVVSKAKWTKPQDVKDMFGNKVDFVGDKRIVFDICGNKYRLVVRAVYHPYYRVMIKFIGTHEDYDAIDVETV